MLMQKWVSNEHDCRGDKAVSIKFCVFFFCDNSLRNKLGAAG
jgi:hypothetical protein